MKLVTLSRRSVFGAVCAIGGFSSTAQGQTAEPPGDPRLASHSDATPALEHVHTRQWRDLSALVRGQTPDSACVLLDYLGDQSAVDLDLTPIASEPMGSAIAGALLVNWAWRYRGSGVASTVTTGMAQAFADRLRNARVKLETAIAANDGSGVAYAFLFRTLKGLSDPQAMENAWTGFESVAHKPIRAYAAFADALTPRWFGSEELLIGFARSQQASLEPSSQALIALAANEYILTRLQSSLETAAAFASQPGVLGEVGAANERFRNGATDEDTYRARFAHSHFAFFFSFVGLHDLARPHLVELGDYVAGPWTRMHDPVDLLERARSLAGLSAT